jgi:hypothetical protein
MPKTRIAATPGHDHALADRVQRPIEGRQGTRVGLGDYAEQDRIRERRAKGDHNREDVQSKNDFVERDRYEHACILLVQVAHATS